MFEENQIIIDFFSNKFSHDFLSLEKYQDYLNWTEVSYNENIVWCEKILINFKETLDWEALSINKSFHKVEPSILRHFIDKINWIEFLNTSSLEWPFVDYLHLKDFFEKPTINYYGTIENYSANNPLMLKIVLHHDIKWEYEYLKKIFKYLIESVGPFIESYLNHNDELIENKCYESLSGYEALISTTNKVFLKKWQKIENGSIDLELSKIIVESNNEWDDWANLEWKFLSSTNIISFTEHLLSLYRHKWVWNRICKNNSIKWTIDLLKEFENDITNYEIIDNWGDILRYGCWKELSSNEGDFWTITLIEIFKDRLNGNLLINNKGVLNNKKIMNYLFKNII